MNCFGRRESQPVGKGTEPTDEGGGERGVRLPSGASASKLGRDSRHGGCGPNPPSAAPWGRTMRSSLCLCHLESGEKSSLLKLQPLVHLSNLRSLSVRPHRGLANNETPLKAFLKKNPLKDSDTFAEFSLSQSPWTSNLVEITTN